MSEYGTTSTFPDWYIRFQQAALAALPRPPELDQKTGLSLANNGETMKQGFAKMLLPKHKDDALAVSASEPLIPFYPADNEIFELTLDGDAVENDPIEMVRRDGHREPKKWKHIGRRVTGTETRRFKLVWVGYCQNFTELKRKLTTHGRIPEGQWREALRAAYALKGTYLVGMADASWMNSAGDARFPCVLMDGYSTFYRIVYDFSVDWHWLVEIKK